jgi:hypothetical protein
MAVYQGTRPRGFGQSYPTSPVTTRALPRRRARASVRAGRAELPVGSLLGAILLVFVVAFFSLAQAIRVSTANYEVDRLTVDRERLQAHQRELQSDLNRLGSEPAVRKLGLDAGLGQLDTPIVLPAR